MNVIGYGLHTIEIKFGSNICSGMFYSVLQNPGEGKSIKIDFGKPFDKSNLNIIDCINQSIKIDSHNCSRFKCHRFFGNQDGYF